MRRIIIGRGKVDHYKILEFKAKFDAIRFLKSYTLVTFNKYMNLKNTLYNIQWRRENEALILNIYFVYDCAKYTDKLLGVAEAIKIFFCFITYVRKRFVSEIYGVKKNEFFTNILKTFQPISNSMKFSQFVSFGHISKSIIGKEAFLDTWLFGKNVYFYGPNGIFPGHNV